MREDRKIKVLTISHYNSMYGANKSLINLIEGTHAQIEWTVICRSRKGNQNVLTNELDRLNIRYYSIPFLTDIRTKGDKGFKNSTPYFLKELLVNLQYAISVSRICKKNSIDIIHSNTSAICFGAYVSFFSGIKHVWHFREFLEKDYNFAYHFGFKYLIFWANKAQQIVAISKAIETECVEKRQILAPSAIVYNGVIYEKDIPELSAKQISEKCKLLMVGALHEAKNQLEAIKAIELLVNNGFSVELTILGNTETPYYNVLTDYIKSKNLSKYIIFKGHVNNPEKAYKESDISIMCSKNEGLGRVTIESMSYGVPVIGYDAAGTSELIRHLHTGLLYKGGEKELSQMIEKLINDEKLYNNLRIQGQADVKKYYTIEQYAKNFLTAIHDL